MPLPVPDGPRPRVVMMKREDREPDVRSFGTIHSDSTDLQPQQTAALLLQRHPQQPTLTQSIPTSTQLAQPSRSQPAGSDDGMWQTSLGGASPVTPPSSSEHAPSPPALSNGPMSTRTILPPRPKPGRKPIPEQEVGDRRRKQNRDAQRKFRDKRQERLSVALGDIANLQKQFKTKELEFQRTLEVQERQAKEMLEVHERKSREAMQIQERQSRDAIEAQERQYRDAIEANSRRFQLDMDQLRQRAETAERRVAELQAKLDHVSPAARTQSKKSIGGVADITPTEEYAETDFTNIWSRKTVPIQRASSTYQLDEATSGFDCGFCTDAGNCLCKAENPEPVVEAPEPLAGSCNGCLSNPSRQACCRQIANSALSAPENTLAPMMPCSRFFDRAEARAQPLTSISQLFGDSLKAYASGSGGFQVSEHEAAEALQTLSTAPSK